MTIDEAIAHAREVAKNKRKNFDECNMKNNYACKFCIEIRTCKEVAEEHEQIAEWLEDYKQIKMLIPIEQALKAEYDKAIDDFVNACSEYYFNVDDSPFRPYLRDINIISQPNIEKIAEQLKEHRANDKSI